MSFVVLEAGHFVMLSHRFGHQAKVPGHFFMLSHRVGHEAKVPLVGLEAQHLGGEDTVSHRRQRQVVQRN